MAAQNTLTFDMVPPRRPSLDDLGGASKTNNLKYPPKLPSQPSAEEHNQWSQLLAYLGRSVAVADFSVHWNSGTGAYQIVGFSAACTSAVVSSFTLTRTGLGVCQIVWPPANGCVLPPTAGTPTLTLNTSQPTGSIHPWAENFVDGGGNPGVQVTMPTDGDFHVHVF